ncbi:MAG: Mur ligase family protein, partial [Candidatus Babeliales bacterium]
MSTIGIIGFGVVGRSIFSFLDTYKHTPEVVKQGKLRDVIDTGQLQLVVWDKRELTADEQASITQTGGIFITGLSTTLEAFIDRCDVVIASPGINIEPYKNSATPILCELDLFSLFFTKPVIAITGSLGKTTTTKLLGALTERLRYHAVGQHNDIGGDVLECDLAGKASVRSAVGGNIGIGMLDLVKQVNEYDLGVLELSSFQLDLNTTFAPDVAVWTNFYPNHLDRHITQEAYFQAKFNLMAGQREGQLA